MLPSYPETSMVFFTFISLYLVQTSTNNRCLIHVSWRDKRVTWWNPLPDFQGIKREFTFKIEYVKAVLQKKYLGGLAIISEIAGDPYPSWRDDILLENFESKEA